MSFGFTPSKRWNTPRRITQRLPKNAAAVSLLAAKNAVRTAADKKEKAKEMPFF
jgi:hypothetical protein